MSKFDSDKEQVDVTKVTDTLCKLKGKIIFFYDTKVWKFSETFPLYCSLLSEQLALHLK